MNPDTSKDLGNQPITAPYPPTASVTMGSMNLEPKQKRKIPKWLKIILIIIAIPILLLILLLAVSFILRTISIQKFKNEYNTATSKCGGNPIIKVHADGWKTNRTEIVTPDNPSYDRYVSSNKSYLGRLIISYDIKSYYCSLEEAGIDPLTGKNTSGVEFHSNANFSDEDQQSLAKRSIEDYEQAYSVKLFQPTFVPEVLNKNNISVLGADRLKRSEIPGYDNFVFTIYFGTSEDRSAITGNVQYECAVSDYAPTIEELNESLSSTPIGQRYSPLEVAYYTNENMRQWKVTYIPVSRTVEEIKENLNSIVCELTDFENIISKEDSRRMMTEFKDLSIESFDKVSFLN